MEQRGRSLVTVTPPSKLGVQAPEASRMVAPRGRSRSRERQRRRSRSRSPSRVYKVNSDSSNPDKH